jgi:hypothetical protein
MEKGTEGGSCIGGRGIVSTKEKKIGKRYEKEMKGKKEIKKEIITKGKKQIQ